MGLGDTIIKPIEPIFEKLEGLEKNQRIMLVAGFFVLSIGAAVYFLFLPKMKNIEWLEAKYQKLTRELKRVKLDAARLDYFRKQYKEAEKEFAAVVKQLPEKDEIPSLLAGISRSGRDVGLEFELFQPKGEIRKEFYAEIPVSIKVVGGYHNVARFFDRVSQLPRIVNMTNIGMAPISSKTGPGGMLATTCTAVTYKFIEPTEKDKASSKKGKKGKKKRRRR